MTKRLQQPDGWSSSQPTLTLFRWILIGSVGLFACGGPKAVQSNDGASETTSTPAETSTEPATDVPATDVVCGQPAEDITPINAPDIAAAGCTVWRGGMTLRANDPVDLSLLSSLRVIEESVGGAGYQGPGTSVFGKLEGLERLESVGGLGFLQEGLLGVDGLRGLREVNGIIRFVGTNLVDIDALSRVRVARGYVTLSENASLTNIAGFSSLEHVAGSLLIESNPLLTNLDGFSALARIDGHLAIHANERLASLAGMSALKRVERDVVIVANPVLPRSEIDALVARIEIGGEVRLE